MMEIVTVRTSKLFENSKIDEEKYVLEYKNCDSESLNLINCNLSSKNSEGGSLYRNR